jgi:hypothetical protein
MPDLSGMSTVYKELKGWQTGIGSVFGLLALMTAALYGEIVLLRKEAASLARAVADVDVNEGCDAIT